MTYDENEDVVAQAGERLRGQLTVLLTVAGRAGEEYARHRRRTLDETAQAAEARATQLRARYDAERAAARAQLTATAEPGWWAAAGPQQVTDTWQTAAAWRDADEQIAADTARLAEEIRRRYGVDPDRLPASAPSDRAVTTAAREQERDDAALAATLVSGEVETGAVPAASGQRDWDSAAARDRRAEAAQASGAGAEAIQARLIGDLSQATAPARAASDRPVASPARPRRPGRSAQARRVPDRGR